VLNKEYLLREKWALTRREVFRSLRPLRLFFFVKTRIRELFEDYVISGPFAESLVNGQTSGEEVSVYTTKLPKVDEKRFINESEAKNYPIHELFYLFLGFITDRRLDVKMTVFEDDLVGFAFENGLFLKRKGFRAVAPELLVLSKMRMLPGRDEEKRLKDMLDALMVFTFYEEFEIRLFRELSKRFRFDKDLVKKELKRARESLSLLGFSEAEATNILTSFGSLLTQA